VANARVYLDHNATTALRPEARDALTAALEVVGAASSVHREGREARKVVERAREQVARLVGVPAEAVSFTSGATEANNTALSPHWVARRNGRGCDRALVSAIEHASILNGSRFEPSRRETLPVTADGVADLAAWTARLSAVARAGETPLVSLMLANNETGALQPVREVADIVRSTGGLMHCDAAQAAGKVPISGVSLGADLLSLSSHKIGGPAGVGALVATSDEWHLGEPLIRGGGQERGARAGTENVAGIAGFGAAAAASLRDLAAEAVRLHALRERVEGAVREAGAVIFAEAVDRLPNTVCFARPGVPAETALIALDLAGVAVSSGSACSSGKVRASHVLEAMGVAAEVVPGAIRVSLGRTTTPGDVETFLSAWNRVLDSIHGRRKVRAA
jgi:cysteine desulfurase